jgi:hypothetical protein
MRWRRWSALVVRRRPIFVVGRRSAFIVRRRTIFVIGRRPAHVVRWRSALIVRSGSLLHHLLFLGATFGMAFTPMRSAAPRRRAIASRRSGLGAAGGAIVFAARWRRTAFVSRRWTGFRWRRRAIGTPRRRRRRGRPVTGPVRPIRVIGAGGQQQGRSQDRGRSKPVAHESPHLAETPSTLPTPQRLFGGNWIK